MNRCRESKSKKVEYLGWCSEATTVTPRSDILFRLLITSFAATASRPEVGSSKISRLGQATSSSPMLTLLASPPEIDPAGESGFPTFAFWMWFSPRTVMVS